MLWKMLLECLRDIVLLLRCFVGAPETSGLDVHSIIRIRTAPERLRRSHSSISESPLNLLVPYKHTSSQSDIRQHLVVAFGELRPVVNPLLPPPPPHPLSVRAGAARVGSASWPAAAAAGR